MVSWSRTECESFRALMGALWQNWERQSSQVKELYVRSIEAWPPRVVKEALEAIKRDQDVERLPSIRRILEVVRERSREYDLRRRAAGAADGGIYASPLERNLAALVAHCAELTDAKGQRWRFLPEGLCCESRNLFWPWTLAKPGQQERLVRSGLEAVGPGLGEVMGPKEFAQEEDFWGPRVNHPDPKRAAWWREQRRRMEGGRLPAVLEEVKRGVPERDFETTGEGPEEEGFTPEPVEAEDDIPF